MTKTILEMEKPTKLDDIVGQEDIVALFKRWNDSRSHTHAIMEGPWGVGKSASVDAMLLEFYGVSYDHNVVKANASMKSERSIEFIEQTIKKMAIKPSRGYPYRVFVFEEGEQLTGDAEKALKEAMVEYSSNAKVIIITNHLNRIDQGIKSRCALVSFKIPDKAYVMELVVDVYDRHHGKFDDPPELEDVINSIFSSENVAPRDALVKLELLLGGFSQDANKSVLMDLSETMMRKFVSEDKSTTARLLKTTVSMYDQIVASVGNYERDIIKYMFGILKESFMEDPTKHGKAAEVFAETDIALQTSSNPTMHITRLLVKLSRIYGSRKNE